MNAPNDRILRLERVFDADPQTVFEAWVNPDWLAQWWGPEGIAIPELSLDVREGGAWTTTMHSRAMGHRTVSGNYRVVDPPNRLAFSWAWDGDDGARGHETEIDIRFERHGGGTRVKLVQQIFARSEDRDNHAGGWQSSFNCLEAFLARGQAKA